MGRSRFRLALRPYWIFPETVTLELFPSLPLTVTENPAPDGALRLAVIVSVAEPMPFEPIEFLLRLALTPRGKVLAPMLRLTGLLVVPSLAPLVEVIVDVAFDPLLTNRPEGRVARSVK